MKTRLLALAVLLLAASALAGCSEAEPAAPSSDAPITPAPTVIPNTVDVEDVSTPSAGAPTDEDLPPSVQILSPKYQEAYRLLPDGPWAQEYYLNVFTEDFDPEEYAALEDVELVTPVRVAPTELDAADEWLLTRIINDSSMGDWLDGKIRELGNSAVLAFETAVTPLDGFRVLAALGWGDDIILISTEWKARKTGISESQIERILEAQRAMRSTIAVHIQLPPKLLTQRVWERKVCVELLSAALDGTPFPWRLLSDGTCDIDETLSLSREALDARNGQSRLTEEDYKEALEFLRAQKAGSLIRAHSHAIQPG